MLTLALVLAVSVLDQFVLDVESGDLPYGLTFEP